MKNDFWIKLPDFSYLISKNDCINSGNLESSINNDIDVKKEPKSFSVVYIYYLYENIITYPAGKSNVIYIGSTCGEMHNGKCSLGYRFKHLSKIKDNKRNLVLSYIYMQKVKK